MQKALIIMAICLMPFAAIAQEAGVTAEPSWLPLLLAVLSAVAGSGLLSTVVKSNSWWMKIIDAIALNWGKARNDPNRQ